MSSSDGDQREGNHEPNSKIGPAPSAPLPDKEASLEEIDAFVRRILGLTERRDVLNRTPSRKTKIT